MSSATRVGVARIGSRYGPAGSAPYRRRAQVGARAVNAVPGTREYLDGPQVPDSVQIQLQLAHRRAASPSAMTTRLTLPQ